MIDSLNQQHAITGHLAFVNGHNGLPKAVVSNSLAHAEIYLHGAHITAFQPHFAEQPVLWMSSEALFQSDKAIRGGIPIVWPWFGPHPDDKDKPQHGFARILEWLVKSSAALDDGGTQLSLQLNANDGTRNLWPHLFELELRITVGATLLVELISRNRGPQTITIGGALHTYFQVGDIDQVQVTGLDGQDYLDQLDNHQRLQQNGPIRVEREVDRIYLDTSDECVLVDNMLRRNIRIANRGSQSTVVWNPWIDKSRQLKDFPDDGYRTMLCIETANTPQDSRQLTPGAEHVLAQLISIENFP